MSDDRIAPRKEQHVRLCVERDVRHRVKTHGFERWEFTHTALPELDLAEIDTATVFLGRPLSFPLLVAGMTGGYPGAHAINGMLAEVCEDLRIAIGAGSMRRALSDDAHHDTYRILRRSAPTVPVLANIGAAEVARMRDASDARRLVDLVEADAIAVHCNPLQEFLQPEGTPAFRGAIDGIAMLVRTLGVPVIVKEVGAGISGAVARRLFDIGVRCIDVAGAGGTSWSGVEMLRRDDALEISPQFWDWGLPTADALREVCAVAPQDACIIASGGIDDGVTLAKSLALGASLGAAARPLLQALAERGADGLRTRLLSWKNDLRGVMFLTGVRSVADLTHAVLHPASPSVAP